MKPRFRVAASGLIKPPAEWIRSFEKLVDKYPPKFVPVAAISKAPGRGKGEGHIFAGKWLLVYSMAGNSVYEYHWLFGWSYMYSYTIGEEL